MRSLTALAIAVVLAACSSAAEDAESSASTSPASTLNQQSESATTETDGSSDTALSATASTTTTSTRPTTLPAEPDPFVGTGQIDRALRSEAGALVVTVTGYEWGSGPCQGLYEARLSDPAGLIVEVTEAVGQSPDGVCEDLGFDHAITVIGAANLDSNQIVDAFDGTAIAITDDIEQIRPSWFTDRTALSACGTDSDDAPAEQNANVRSCFEDTYDARTPAEIEVISYGDEGETAHRLFRIVDAERLEVLEEFRPPVDGDVTTGSPWTWSIYECNEFVFLEEPGFEIDRRPLLNANGECAVERTQL